MIPRGLRWPRDAVLDRVHDRFAAASARRSLPEATEYALRVRRLDWPGLAALWRAVQAGRPPGWEPGKALEHLVLRAFELDGADVRWPFTVHLEGQVVEQIDGAVYAAGLSCIVEAKDTLRPLSVEPIAKLRAQLSRRPAGVVGLMFSRSGFSQAAIVLAQYGAPQNVLLWRGSELEDAIRERRIVGRLQAKYRECVETGYPYLRVAPAL